MINGDDEDEGLLTNTQVTGSRRRMRHCYLLFVICVFIIAFMAGFLIRMFLSENKSSMHKTVKEDNKKFHNIVMHEMAASKIGENLK